MRFLATLSILLFSLVPVAAQSLPSWRQIIPAAASVRGNQGADWRTDVIIHNPNRVSLVLTLQLVGPSPDGTPQTPDTVVIPEALEPDATRVITNVIESLFPERSTGTLIVTARDTEGATSPIIVTSRIWTPSGTDQGTFGQGLPTIPWDDDGAISGPERVLVGLESTEAFRTNIGLANLSQTVLGVFSIEILDASGHIQAAHWLELPPQSWIQHNGILAFLGLEGSDMTAVVHLADWHDLSPGVPGPVPAPDWLAYGSIIDNRTNDPSFVEALKETTKWGITRQRVIPAAAHTEGAEGSQWVTDASIYQSLDSEVTLLQIEVIPSNGKKGAPPSKYTAAIRPGQTLAIDDIIGTHFSSHEVAALSIRGLNDSGLSDLKVSSRTWTASNNGQGSFGQSIPGMPRRYGADPVIVPGLRESDSFRSNLGIVNPSTNLREILAIEILDAAGDLQGSMTRTMEPKTQTQINGILEELGLEGSGFTAILTLQSSENLFLKPSDPWEPIFSAYGSVIDNRTNDPTFISGTPLPSAEEGDSGDWIDFNDDEPWFRCPDAEIPEEATLIRTFNQAYHYFGAENRRTIVEEVDFPEGGDWNQIGLRIDLECPESGDCDDWDRTGSLQMVLNPEDAEEDWEYLELARYITPYHLEMCEYIDITALGPLLTGHTTLVSWIDTWVGPGHSSGEGWRITYDFVFYPGTPRTPVEVLNVWGRRTVSIGDPNNPIEGQVEPVPIAIPADVTRVEARLITTGHAFGNTENCAEFCILRQDISVGDQQLSVLPWRTDCEYNPHSPQAGTWTYDRNGWCPGAVVVGDMVNLTDLVTPGETSLIDFDIRRQDGSVYENTHTGGTTPFEWVSMQVFLYR